MYFTHNVFWNVVENKQINKLFAQTRQHEKQAPGSVMTPQ